MSSIKLVGVRLSYPNLFVPQVNKGDDGVETSKFGCAIILDKKQHRKEIALLEAEIQKLAKEHWKGKVPGSMKPCLRDGSERDDKDGYGDDVMFLNASSKRKPPVVDRNLDPLTEQDSIPYAGCYVIVTISLWAQDNKFGKRVNAQLRAVQFYKHGDAFGDAPVDAEDEFTALDDDDEPESGKASDKAKGTKAKKEDPALSMLDDDDD